MINRSPHAISRLKHRFFLVCIFFFGSLFSLHGDEREAEDLFFEANVKFAEEAYAEAVPLYEAALAQKPSANTHFNLGNAYRHLGNRGKARIHWERTIATDPGHSSARHNLATLLRELDLADDSSGFWTSGVAFLSYSQWLWTCVLSFWVMAFSALAARWRNSRRLFSLALAGAVGSVAAVAALLLLHTSLDHAIVLDEQAVLQVAPTPGSPVADLLSPAQLVRLNESFGDYVLVSLEDGREGYVQKSQVERIR